MSPGWAWGGARFPAEGRRRRHPEGHADLSKNPSETAGARAGGRESIRLDTAAAADAVALRWTQRRRARGKASQLLMYGPKKL